MAPLRPLHCTGAQGPSGAAGQTPPKSNEPSTSMWPMVLPESPFLTFCFAMWRSLSRRRSAPPPHSSAQYGVIAPFTSTHACTTAGEEACTNTSENWRGRVVEHHWPNELLTAARATAPGRACWGQPHFMWFSWGFHRVFMGFSWGFHGVAPGRPKCYVFIHKMNLRGGPRGPQGHRPV